MKVRIEVTAEDIADGLRKDACDCPIARAIKRAASGARVYVDGDVVYLRPRTATLAWMRLPEEARSFVYRFDRDGDVLPFGFELDVPQTPHALAYFSKEAAR